MNDRRFIVFGDLIADCYYLDDKLLGIDGGSSRFNVIANLAGMSCKNSIIGGCGNDKKGENIVKKMKELNMDTSQIFFRNAKTKAYYLFVDKAKLPKITYNCSKKSPKDGKTTWYDDNLEDISYYHSKAKDNDVIVLDDLDELSLAIINMFKCDKMLDVGKTSQLERLRDDQILGLKNKIKILQLNERVVPYLMQRFECRNLLEISKLFQPKLLIVTHGKDGADFVFEDKVYKKKLDNSANEVDATGAGDAFLSVFIKKYYDNLEQVDYDFIDDTFEEAVKLTSKVVGHVGARGHLYDKLLNKKLEREEQAEELEL